MTTATVHATNAMPRDPRVQVIVATLSDPQVAEVLRRANRAWCDEMPIEELLSTPQHNRMWLTDTIEMNCVVGAPDAQLAELEGFAVQARIACPTIVEPEALDDGALARLTARGPSLWEELHPRELCASIAARDGGEISDTTAKVIRDVLLGLNYGIDQPGDYETLSDLLNAPGPEDEAAREWRILGAVILGIELGAHRIAGGWMIRLLLSDPARIAACDWDALEKKLDDLRSPYR
jgi:hypothetical protein